MHMTDRGLLALVRHEGLVPGPYLDVKQVWTFGIGHTAAAGPPDPATMPRGMPADLDAGIREAFRVFRADLARYEAAVLRAVKVPQPAMRNEPARGRRRVERGRRPPSRCLLLLAALASPLTHRCACRDTGTRRWPAQLKQRLVQDSC